MTQSEMLQAQLFRFSLVALFALSTVVFMGKSDQQSLQALDSATHARLARQVTGNGLTPVLPMRNWETDRDAKAGFNDHPFALFYVNGWFMRLLGADAWSARLLPSAFAVGCVLLVVWMGLAAGIGMWIKNPVSFLVFPSAFIALFLTGTFNRREIKTLLIFSSNCNGWWLINSADFQIHRRIDGFSTGQLTSYPQIVGAPQWTA